VLGEHLIVDLTGLDHVLHAVADGYECDHLKGSMALREQ